MINLLPSEVKQRRRHLSRLYLLTFVYILVSAVSVLGAIGLFSYNFSQNRQISDKEEQISQVDAQKSAQKEIVDEAIFIEDRLNNSSSYQDKTKWDDLLSQVAEATPTDVQLTNLKLAADANKPISLSLSGKTVDRRSIVLFKDKLSKDGHYSLVEITNISDTGDSSNSFTFNITAQINN